jgi:hypothetical protein
MGVDVSDVKPPEFHTKEYDILERESDWFVDSYSVLLYKNDTL